MTSPDQLREMGLPKTAEIVQIEETTELGWGASPAEFYASILELLAALADRDAEIVRLEEEFEHTIPDSWDGIMAKLRKVYPQDVAYFRDSDDIGPTVIRTVYAIDQERQRADTAEALNDRWNKATSIMTIGGSEFINDPEFTAEHVRARQRQAFDAVRRANKRRKEAEAKVNFYEDGVRELNALIDSMKQQVKAAEAALAETIVRVQQCHAYRMPVMARDVETGEVGVHWIDGFDRAEVGAALRAECGEWTPYESVAWQDDPEAALAKAEERLKPLCLFYGDGMPPESSICSVSPGCETCAHYLPNVLAKAEVELLSVRLSHRDLVMCESCNRVVPAEDAENWQCTSDSCDLCPGCWDEFVKPTDPDAPKHDCCGREGQPPEANVESGEWLCDCSCHFEEADCG